LGKTFQHLAAPVLLTGLSASVGFGAPMLTNQPAMRNFGLVMDLGILSAVTACLVFLPPLYAALKPTQDYREKLFYRALYTPVGFKIILWGWRWCGRWICTQVARMIGLAYACTHPKTVRAVRQNLALVDPDAAGFGDACQLFMNQAEGLTQYGRLATHPPEKVLDWIGNARGLDHLKNVLQQDTGCLLVTGHFGFFEFGGLLLSKMGFPVTAITMPEPSSALTEWRAQFRRRWGVETIVIGNGSFAALDVVRAIHNKRFVALLVDRPMDAQTVAVDLPHGKMLFSTGPALVALLAKCPVVPVGIIQQPDGRFEMVATGVIQPEWIPAGRAASLEQLTRQIADQLLPLFQAHPKQWYHFHPVRHPSDQELQSETLS
jgi:KDO2-lipid IV(A) lauroyltransferase